MFIELVDALRCPVPHEESWLVAATGSMNARHIVDGMLGCPVCGAEYPIRHGAVDFRRGAQSPAPHRVPSSGDQAMRLAALLNLVDTQGFVLLMGGWGAHAAELQAVVEVPIIVVDPPVDFTGGPGLSIVRSTGVLPLAQGSARATAIDGGDDVRVASAVRSTKAKGRVVAPLEVGMPNGVREIARDDMLWVGECETLASPPLTLHVRRG